MADKESNVSNEVDVEMRKFSLWAKCMDEDSFVNLYKNQENWPEWKLRRFYRYRQNPAFDVFVERHKRAGEGDAKAILHAEVDVHRIVQSSFDPREQGMDPNSWVSRARAQQPIPSPSGPIEPGTHVKDTHIPPHYDPPTPLGNPGGPRRFVKDIPVIPPWKKPFSKS